MENRMNEFSFNRATIIGRLAHDPTIKTTPAGKTTASFVVATTSEWRDRSGNRSTKTFAHRVMVFELESAKFAARRLRKGSRVLVEGELQLRRWINKTTGEPENFVTEIILSGFGARLQLLDDPPRPEAVQTEASAEDDDDSQTPLSITRSHAKYGDADDTDADDTETSGLSRFLQEPDDNSRARLRAASDDRRNSQ
jgi:single-strand DNA-binding protein